jgi:hypothetical protein
MDNILKLIVGCLGLVGLIVMIVPNSDPLVSKPAKTGETPAVASAPSNAAVPPPPPAMEATPQEQANPGEFAVDDYDIANFGQPMVDPTPPGQPNWQAQQQPMLPQGQGMSGDQSQSGQAGFGQPQIGSSQSTGPVRVPPPPTVGAN